MYKRVMSATQNLGQKMAELSKTRSAKALDMRKAGLTYQQIGYALGVSRARAHSIVQKAMQKKQATK